MSGTDTTTLQRLRAELEGLWAILPGLPAQPARKKGG